MRSRVKNRKVLVVLALVLFSGTMVFAQEKKVTLGLSLDQGIGVITNAEKVSKVFFNPDTPTATDETVYAKQPWLSNQLAFDMSLNESGIIISAGVRLFHYKLVQDSILPTYYFTPYYGTKTVWQSDGMPFLSVGYRHKWANKLHLLHFASFGMVQFIKRYKEYGVPYSSTTSAINTWYNQNRPYEGFNYRFRKDVQSRSFEVGSSVCYELGIWSFKAGLAYFYYRNPPIEGYHGLHVKVGTSVQFKKNEKSGKK